MLNSNVKKLYLWILVIVFLTPNLVVIIAGIESFPFTCAPMFSHYIDEDIELHSFKFEGVDQFGQKTDLIDYYGKSEVTFERHFFSKAYGSIEQRNPFSHRLVDNKELFNARIKSFFNNYSSFLLKHYNLSYSKIIVSSVEVDFVNKNNSKTRLIGSFDTKNKIFLFGK